MHRALVLALLAAAAFARGQTAPAGGRRPAYSTWESLAQHPNPAWFDDAKFGIYAHWGVYSVPAFGNEWYARWMYQPGEVPNRGDYFRYHTERFGDPTRFGYKDLVPRFTAEKFDAAEWAELYRRAGARFAGPVAEHHDGFSMWASEVNAWNAARMGPKRDVTGELARELRARGLKFLASLHHERRWWFYETSYTDDRRHDTEDPRYAGIGKLYPPPHAKGAPTSPEYMREWEAKVREVVDKYRPDVLWFDGGLNREAYYRSALPGFREHVRSAVAYYYNKAEEWKKPVVVTYKHQDLPEGAGILDLERGRMAGLSPKKWLTDTAVDRRSWCYVRNPDYKPVNEIVDVLVDIVSKNGNMLLNVGPRPDGTIPDEQKAILLGIGKWLEVNGEAIYGTRAWRTHGEGPTRETAGTFGERQEVRYTAEDIRFTTRGDALYAIALDWPAGSVTIRSLAARDVNVRSVRLLGNSGELKWSWVAEGLRIEPPAERPCDHACAFKLVLERR